MITYSCKQSSYVANGEVLKANKYETSSKNQSIKDSVEDDNVIGKECRQRELYSLLILRILIKKRKKKRNQKEKR